MKFIHCKNCNEEVALDEVLDVWYHVATDKTWCHPFGAYTEPTHAEPGNEIETNQGPIFSVCKNCNRTIQQGAFNRWYHVDNYQAHCVEEGYDTPIAEPVVSETRGPGDAKMGMKVCKYCETHIVWNEESDFWVHDDGHRYCSPNNDHDVATPELPIENSVESNSRSKNGSIQNFGPKIESEIRSDEAQPSQQPGGSLTGRIISLHYTIQNTVLPVHHKLKAYDALNTLLKIATQAEARIQIGDGFSLSQDDVFDHDEWGL